MTYDSEAHKRCLDGKFRGGSPHGFGAVHAECRSCMKMEMEHRRHVNTTEEEELKQEPKRSPPEGGEKPRVQRG